MDESEGGEGVRDVPAGDFTRNDVDIVENVGEVTLALIGTEQVCCTPPIKTKINKSCMIMSRAAFYKRNYDLRPN